MIVYERALITAPASEPVTRAEAKAHCNVDFTDDDAIFDALIPTARQKLEAECSRALITQTWEIYPPCFPCGDSIRLPLGGLQSITSLAATATDNTTTTWTPSGGDLVNAASTVVAHVDTKSQRGRIVLAYGQIWPVLTLKTANPITIRFVCGYGATAASVPSPLKHAMLLLIEQWYLNRDIAVAGKSVTMIELPHTVDSLISNFRLY